MDSRASNVISINDMSGGASTGRTVKVSWTHHENVEQQATKEAPNEFPLFFPAHETPEKEEKCSMFSQSLNNSLACSPQFVQIHAMAH